VSGGPLPGDCFAYGGERIGVRAALDLLRERVAPVAGTETVPLARAAGRVLAETVVSPRDVPGFDNAAVDGYAFAPTGARPAGRLRAAAAASRRSASTSGPAARPPAPVPRHDPAPARAEGAHRRADAARHRHGGAPGGGRRRGRPALVPAGLRPAPTGGAPARTSAAASPSSSPASASPPSTSASPPSSGFAELRVRQPLDVAVFSTGDELVPPAAPCPKAASTTRTASS
jgi:molybdopterin molybdotransferase